MGAEAMKAAILFFPAAAACAMPHPMQTAEDLPLLPLAAPWKLALSECLYWPVDQLEALPSALLLAVWEERRDPAAFVQALLDECPLHLLPEGLDAGLMVARAMRWLGGD
jgi:hypothetical protein